MIMVVPELLPGVLEKIVHCQLEDGSGGHVSVAQGYGLLKGRHGESIYFVDTALRDIRLKDLKVGQTVYYAPELGPLSRAVEVWASQESKEREPR